MATGILTLGCRPVLIRCSESIAKALGAIPTADDNAVIPIVTDTGRVYHMPVDADALRR